jgi:hypothetical protein
VERNYSSYGLDFTFELVEGAAHSGSLILPAVECWLGALIDTSE